MDEILAQKEKYITLEREKQITTQKFSYIEMKNQLLVDLNVAEVNFEALTANWQKFSKETSNYQDKVQASIQNFKHQVKQSFKSMDQQLENFYEKWIALKPKSLADLSLE